MNEEGKTLEGPQAVPVFDESELLGAELDDIPMLSAEDMDFVIPEEQNEQTGGDEYAKGLYEALVEKQIIPEIEEFNGDWDVLDKEIDALPQRVQEAILHQTPEIGKNLIDYVFTMGENLDKDSLKEFVNTYINDITEIPERSFTLEKARDYLKEVYTSKGGMEEDEIEILLDTLEDKEEDGSALLKRAEKFDKNERDSKKVQHKSVLEAKKAEKLEAETKQKEFLNTVISEIDSSEWDKSRINDVKKILVSNKINDIFMSAFNNPKSLVQLANLATFFDNETGLFNFESYVKQASSKEIKNLKNNILRDKFKTGTSSRGSSSNTSTPSLGDDLRPIL